VLICIFNSILFLDGYLFDFNIISCDVPNCWSKYFCCNTEKDLDKSGIRLISLDHSSNGITRSPVLPRDTSNISMASRIINIFWSKS